MTVEGWIVVGVIATCLILLLTTSLAVDLVLLGGLAFLLISGIINPNDALSGFSNEGTLTIAALFVVAAALKATGAIQFITQKILGDSSTVKSAQSRMMPPVMLLSAFLNNTPIVASFIPALEDWSKKTGIPVSKVLIPLSYAAILGGTCTLIGTSTNLILNGLLIENSSEGSLGLFDPALIGIPCAIAGFIYIYLFGDSLLPSRGEAFESFRDTRQYTVEMIVPNGSSIARKTVQEAGLRQLPGLYLVEILREGVVLPAVGPNQRLRVKDRLLFTGVVESIVDLQNIQGLEIADKQVFSFSDQVKNRVLVEAVVSDSHPLNGISVRDGKFRNLYNAVIIAVSRSGERIKDKIGNIILQSGDTLLLESQPSFLDKFKNSNEFFLISPLEGVKRTNYDKSGLSFIVLLAMVLLAGLGFLSMLQAAFLAVGVLIISRSINYAEAIKSIDWRLIIAIASAIGIGTSLSTTGISSEIASLIMTLERSTPILILIAVFLVTWLLTELITNVAAAVLLFPIVFSVTESLGLNIVPFIMVMIIAASASFSTPLGYQTNLMVYGPGGYKFLDYLKIGIPLNIIVAIITLTLVPIFWEF